MVIRCYKAFLKSLPICHHFNRHTENPRKLQQENLDFNDNLKHFYINLRQ
nr:MAG TPA: hypothetical protein [Caudoviricetes sp.]